MSLGTFVPRNLLTKLISWTFEFFSRAEQKVSNKSFNKFRSLKILWNKKPKREISAIMSGYKQFHKKLDEKVKSGEIRSPVEIEFIDQMFLQTGKKIDDKNEILKL